MTFSWSSLSWSDWRGEDALLGRWNEFSIKERCNFTCGLNSALQIWSRFFEEENKWEEKEVNLRPRVKTICEWLGKSVKWCSPRWSFWTWAFFSWGPLGRKVFTRMGRLKFLNKWGNLHACCMVGIHPWSSKGRIDVLYPLYDENKKIWKQLDHIVLSLLQENICRPSMDSGNTTTSRYWKTGGSALDYDPVSMFEAQFKATVTAKLITYYFKAPISDMLTRVQWCKAHFNILLGSKQIPPSSFGMWCCDHADARWKSEAAI